MGGMGEIKREYALHDAVETTKIHDNRISGTDGHGYRFGIDLDDGASNFEIYNNLLLGVSLKLREGFDRKVYNNIIIGDTMEQHVSYANNNDEYYDNIVVNSVGFNFIALNDGHTTSYERMFYYNNGEKVQNAAGNVNTNWESPVFNNRAGSDYSVADSSLVFKLTRFKNFDMSSSRFGHSDRPKAPVYTGVAKE
jgi:hypothetical protein